jgi:hypothetical protein
MKRFLVGSVAVAMASVFYVGCGASPASDGQVSQSGADISSSAATAAEGGLRHVYARPDERLCPSPECGGYWLVASSFHNACDNQESNTYVAAIRVGDHDLSPTCHELLTGFIVPDPQDPNVNILELEVE